MRIRECVCVCVCECVLEMFAMAQVCPLLRVCVCPMDT